MKLGYEQKFGSYPRGRVLLQNPAPIFSPNVLPKPQPDNPNRADELNKTPPENGRQIACLGTIMIMLGPRH